MILHKIYGVKVKMVLTERIKNYLGDKCGRARCPITGNTTWKADYLLVPVAEKRYALINAEALDRYDLRGLAEKVHNEFFPKRAWAREDERFKKRLKKVYSVDDIISTYPEWEILFNNGKISYVKEHSDLMKKLR